MRDFVNGDRVRIANASPMGNEQWPRGVVEGVLDTPTGPFVIVAFDGWMTMALPAHELAVITTREIEEARLSLDEAEAEVARLRACLQRVAD